MNGLKTTLISILTIGLLAGSTVGVAAQDEGEAGLDVPAPFLARFGPGPDEEALWDAETRILGTTGTLVEATDPRVSGLVTAFTAAGGVGNRVSHLPSCVRT